MPVALTRIEADLARMRGAEIEPPEMEEPRETEDAESRALAEVAQSVGQLATRITELTAEQQAAVLAMAGQHKATMEMLAKLLAPKAKVLEEWDMTVTDRDEQGRVKRATIKQKR